MVLIDDEIILIDAAKEYLTFFLEKQGTFYPFAMIMDAKGITYPLEREITEEHPSPQSLIRVYEQTFHNELKKNALVQQRTDFFVILAWNIKNTLQKA